jgi:hypothetical protein
MPVVYNPALPSREALLGGRKIFPSRWEMMAYAELPMRYAEALQCESGNICF